MCVYIIFYLFIYIIYLCIIYIWDLLDWLPWYHLCSPSMLNPWWVVSVWHWRPGGFLENYCASVYVGILKKVVLVRVKQCHSHRTDELTTKSEGKQAKHKKFLSSMSFYSGGHQKVPPPFRESFPFSDNVIKKFLHSCAYMRVIQLISDLVKLTAEISSHVISRHLI